MNACTIIAWNYLAHARVLAESFRSHHPQGRFSVLLLDDPLGEFHAEGEVFHLVRPDDIMEPEEFDRLALMYDVTELATAVKPWLMRHLLKPDQSELVFFDPDIQVFAPLDDVADLARRHSIVLTPHDIEPMPRDGCNPTEIQMLQSGAYNLGFIALGRESGRFLDWWRERLRLHCVAAPEQGLFVDQKWIDFVPGYFDHYILKDPGFNVAYWNLCNRNLARNGVRYLVNDRPLRFFHFSGFDPEKPHLLSRHPLPAPRILLSQYPTVREICEAYAKLLFEHDFARLSRRAYGLGSLRNGLRIDRRMRWIYRHALLEFERGRGEEPPPANGDPEEIVGWLNGPKVRSISASISRYLHSVYSERIDLMAAFPDLPGADGPRYLSWVRETGMEEARIPEAFRPAAGDAPGPGAPRPSDGPLRPGVNLVGYFRAELGVGEAARQFVAAAERVGLAYATLTLEDTVSRQDNAFNDWCGETPYDFNIVCVNADMLPGCARKLGREFFDRRYTIGVWHWEISTFPREWCGAFEYVDEIWVASEHTASSLASISPKPVQVIPPPVEPPPIADLTRADLGLPDGFLFLFIFDFMSVSERKNPLGLIEAFARAFAPGEGPVLVLKSINGEKTIEAFERLKLSAAGRPDVLVIDRYFSPEATVALTAVCDCYVSLHRAEGFGLTMAEAMALGKPVIATGFSGNLTYMSDENSYLVRYRMERIPEGCAPYPAGAEWAGPDIEDAARLMRHVYEHPDEALAKGRRAREDLLDGHSPQVRGELIGRRLAEIRRQRSLSAPAGSEPTECEKAETGPTAPEPTGSEPRRPSVHERAHSRAAAFPGSPWETTRRYRPILPAVRATLFRLLRPYTASLGELHAAILADALELRERFDRFERERIPALRSEVGEGNAAVLERIRRLERRIQALERGMPALQDEIGAGQTRTAKLFGRLLDRIAPLEEKMARALGRHRDVERHLEKLVSDVSRFQDAASAHLASLTKEVQTGQGTLDRLSRELHALPYTAETLRFRTEDGLECIGYDSADESGAEFEPGSSFEDSFRGPGAFIRGRLSAYLDMVRHHRPLVDIGCGRGEFLDLLADAGMSGVGVDINPGMVARCRRNGHEVELADAGDFLAAQRDGSIGCIFSAQLIEHLPFESLLALFRLSRSKLSPGGLFIAETVNPHSVSAMKNFWVDLSHQKPIFPEVAVTLCRLQGFASARIFFPQGGGSLEEDLWERGEYAVVARAPLTKG
jgi:glycosyltransferase involved in cell wall biosynthesis/SAM-dependent methyltransferase